ncbi:T9SS type A sorting domain-containing protein [Owenweeksia hongkongensis]|uniref:T9SS type A sorting domain-containing protein n=1 Tax=Owenweeksia hongkongensis TaxID=253245 RepID=UPI003A944B58
MKTISTLILCGISLLAFSQSTDQKVVASSGGHYSNGNNQLSFTIGEPVISTASNSGVTLTQGFHQTKLQVISLEEFSNDPLISVFPNPVVESLNITTEKLTESGWLTLYSVNGKLLLQQKLVPGESQTIDMTSYSDGSYYLRFMAGETIKQTFSIIKSH